MKKTKLIAGICLMILGIGVTVGSAAFRFHEHSRYGMMNTSHRIVNGRGMMGGYGVRGSNGRGFTVKPYQNRDQNTNPLPNQNQNQRPNLNPNPSLRPNPSPNQNQGQSGNGGVNQ